MIGAAASLSNHPKKAEQFALLTEPERPILLRRALQLTRNRADAEDLVQDTYLRAYRFFDTFHCENSIRAWLLRIQKNVFINQFRHKRLVQHSLPVDRSQSAEELDLPGEGRLHEMNPRECMAHEELDEEISAAMSYLPESFRQILFLAAVQDYTYEEMAVILVCPVGTVRSRLSRAKSILRRRLQVPARRHGFARN